MGESEPTSRLLRWLVAVVVPVAWGVIAGWWTLRSPLTTREALWSIGISVAVGAVAGAAARSRWMMLVAPVLFAGVFELVRLPISGPTVDGIHFTLYGLMTFAVGRGFHALISVLPMVLGAAFGAGYAPLGRGRAGSRPGAAGAAWGGRVGCCRAGRVRRDARPAGRHRADRRPGRAPARWQRRGADACRGGRPAAGHDDRGHDTGNPVLLFLAGGPDGSELGAMRNHLPELEEHSTVATWDQRGAGTSYPTLDPTSTYTLDSAVAVTVTVTNYLRQRFSKEQIYLLGAFMDTFAVLYPQLQGIDFRTAPRPCRCRPSSPSARTRHPGAPNRSSSGMPLCAPRASSGPSSITPVTARCSSSCSSSSPS